MMKIKANQSLYRNILIVLAVLIIFIGSFGYFLGFDINLESLLYYFLFISLVIVICFVSFLLIDQINKKYIIFDEEKIIEKSNQSERILLYYNQIVRIQYYNRIDVIREIMDLGYAEIMYKCDAKDHTPQYLTIYLSKKHYDQFLVIKRNFSS